MALIRYCGLRAAYLLLYPVSFYFLFFAPKALRASREYLRRAGAGGSLWACARHFYSFGQSLLDRVAVIGNRAGEFEYAVEGLEHLRAALDEGKGAVVVTAHFGNWEMAAHLLQRSLDVPVHVVARENEVPHIERYFKKALKDRSFSVILADASATTSMAIACALAQGEVVAIPGDRTMGSHSETLPFLGAPARFPSGPYTVAAVTGAPLLHTFTMREKRFRYRFKAYPPEHLSFGGRNEREGQIRGWVERFVRRLEEQVRRYPFQWNNFYSFWES